MTTVHKNITITGKVQGVGFRYKCKHQAQLVGVKGFVRNNVDGSVYIEVEGTNLQITQFTKWCYEGPPHARVSNVCIEDGNIVNFKVFDIKR